MTWVVGVITANYLGVEAWGTLSFALSVAAIGASVTAAGLSGLVVRDLVRERDLAGEILGTVATIRAFAGAIVLSLLLVIALAVDGSEAGNALLILVVSIGMALRMSDVFTMWFQSEMELRYVAISGVATALMSNAARLGLVVAGAPLMAFGAVVAAEQLLLSLWLGVYYQRRTRALGSWRYRTGRASSYLRQSWPLILAGVANEVNLRADQVLLGILASASAVGTYAVAARLSEVWYFMPMAVAGALFPVLVRAKDADAELYRSRLRQMYAAFIWGGIILALVMTAVGPPLIRLLYDSEFADATSVLLIHIWSAPFLFMGVVFSRWLILEGLLVTSLVRHGLGAIINVGLNLWWIPLYGPEGAALATVVSYGTATYGASFLTASTRPAARDMTAGFLLPAAAVGRAVSRRTTRGIWR